MVQAQCCKHSTGISLFYQHNHSLLVIPSLPQLTNEDTMAVGISYRRSLSSKAGFKPRRLMLQSLLLTPSLHFWLDKF